MSSECSFRHDVLLGIVADFFLFGRKNYFNGITFIVNIRQDVNMLYRMMYACMYIRCTHIVIKFAKYCIFCTYFDWKKGSNI